MNKSNLTGKIKLIRPWKHISLGKIYKFFAKPGVLFLLGMIVGAVIFGFIYGYNLINFDQTSWIFTAFAHDTGQHQLGWEFFAQGSNGVRITDLAYPSGIPLMFMDSIPLFGFLFKLFGFGANQQYFGLFGFLSYVLFGGFAALILRWIFAKLRNVFKSFFVQIQLETLCQFEIIFVLLGTVLLTVSPLLIARTFYHTALSAQWLILAGFTLIIYRQKLFAKRRGLLKFIFIWTLLLSITVLIHAYFLPMLVAIMVVNFVLMDFGLTKSARENLFHILQLRVNFANLRHEKTGLIEMFFVYMLQFMSAIFYILKYMFELFLPAVIAGVVFIAIGGLSLGGQTGATDLFDKGFNLLSFIYPAGYSSVIPATGSIARSGSPETNMWLGFGIIAALILSLAMQIFRAKKLDIKNRSSWTRDFRETFRSRLRLIRGFGKTRSALLVLVILLLLLFSFSPSIQFGPLVLVRYYVPNSLLQIWESFRAAAREAWPFYYALQFFAIYIFAKEFLKFAQRIDLRKNGKSQNKFRAWFRKSENILSVLALLIFVLTVTQVFDILLSPVVNDRRQNFAKFANHTADYEFPIRLLGIMTTQKHLVDLDPSMSGDMSSFNTLGQTAIQNKLTLNIGYFSRIPAQAKSGQSIWRTKISESRLTNAELRENLFVTKDQNFAKEISRNYRVVEEDGYYFVIAK